MREQELAGRRDRWRVTRVARTLRGLWPDHNPLRRPSDRAEAGIIATLVVAFLAAAPLIALLAWRLTYSNTFTTLNAQHAGWHQVSAVLLKDAPSGPYDAWVPARWTGPGEQRRTGVILAPQGTPAGATVRVWTSASGRPAAAPLAPFSAACQADLAAVIAVEFWALGLLCAGLVTHHILEVRRLAVWDTWWRASDLSGPADATPGR
jgi:hypothetical protein